MATTTTKTKIHQVAKEIGVDSKIIIAKLTAEGIPNAEAMTHMSTIPIGLAATIREWFSDHAPGESVTAVETAEKVDLGTVKTKPPARKKSTKAKAGEKDSGAGADEPAAAEQPAPAEPATPPVKAEPVAPAPKVEPVAVEPPKAERIVPKVEQPAAAETAAAPQAVTEAKPAPARVMKPTSVQPEIRPAATETAAPQSTEQKGNDGSAAAAAATHTERPHRPGGAGGHGGSARPGLGQMRGAPAPMNVPTRPTVVAPAGQKLEVRAPVVLRGPKVVRVEAAEQVEAPRARRPGGPGMAPGGGTGTRGPRPGEEDDRGRSPRRKVGGGAGTGAAAGGAGAKRSSGVGVPQRRRASSGEEWVGGQIFSEQDLLERQARLERSGGFLKKRKQDLTKQAPGERAATAAQTGGKLRIEGPFTIKELSAATGVKGADIVKKLFLQGVPATINSAIDTAKAVEIMMDFDIELEVQERRTAEETLTDDFESREASDLRPRGPVVTILGHVDHGKTSLLDKIRNANVAAGEAGGITQKTSAFVVEIEVEGEKKQVVFLDTPGHEAFTSMRARGAKMTDVVVLVVSAPEGVMPQTIESINHAKAAGVPLVVALNKVDRPDATESQIQRVLGDLAKAGVNPVQWGGDTEVVRVSAVTGEGIPELLQVLDLQAGVLELKADFDGPAQGSVIEAKMEEGRGAVANILIQQGCLRVGDFIAMGRAFGRVRDITDDKGRRIKEAMPPMPVQVSGLDMVCDAGDKFYVTDSLRKAEEAAEQRRHRERHTALAQPKVTLDALFSQIQAQEAEVKEIRVILKTDQQGTVEILKGECEKIKTSEVKVRVLHAAVGGITEADVQLADASKAIIIGFNVIPSGKARTLSEQKGVEIRTYQVIYDITDDLRKAAEGMLTPELREEVLGHAEVRAVFRITKVGSVAGCYVTDGTVLRDALIRVTRNGVVIEHDRKLAQLKRVKDDAREVRAGLECGMKIDGYDDIKEGDVLECYKKVEVKRTL